MNRSEDPNRQECALSEEDRWSSEADEFLRGFIERRAGQDAQQAATQAERPAPAPAEEQPPLEVWWCQHPRLSPPRLRLTKNGPRHRRQCQDCGAAVGNAVSKIDAEKENGARPALPFDEAFYERGQRREADHQQARLAAHQAKRTAWWQWYDRYLQSPEWRDKRYRVLRRAKGVCEGCLLFPAAHIHHTTYAHVGNELLFELVALCEGCHDRVHEDNPNAPLAWMMRDGPP